jgi:hypothetical protein
MWMLCPLIDQGWLTEAWASALRKAGVECEGINKVFVRQIRPLRPAEFMRELVKRADALKLSKLGSVNNTSGEFFEYIDGWTIAEADSNGGAGIDTLGDLYESLEGRRTMQCSRKLLPAHVPAECPCCGAQGTLRHAAKPMPMGALRAMNRESQETRGPPSAQAG